MSFFAFWLCTLLGRSVLARYFPGALWTRCRAGPGGITLALFAIGPLDDALRCCTGSLGNNASLETQVVLSQTRIGCRAGTGRTGGPSGVGRRSRRAGRACIVEVSAGMRVSDSPSYRFV